MGRRRRFDACPGWPYTVKPEEVGPNDMGKPSAICPHCKRRIGVEYPPDGQIFLRPHKPTAPENSYARVPAVKPVLARRVPLVRDEGV